MGIRVSKKTGTVLTREGKKDRPPRRKNAVKWEMM